MVENRRNHRRFQAFRGIIHGIFIDLELERNIKMRERMKVLVGALAALIVLGVCNTAPAEQNVKYDGKCYKS